MTVAKEVTNVKLESTAIIVELKNEGDTTITNNASYVGKTTDKDGKVTPSSSSVIKIYNYEQLEGLAEYTSSSVKNNFINGKTLSIEADIDCTGKKWIPFGMYYENSYYGTIKGNSHKIIGLSNALTPANTLENFAATSSGISGDIFGFIACACTTNDSSVAISNLTFEDVSIVGDNLKGAAAVIGIFGDKKSGAASNVKATIDNVTVSGTISGKDKCAGFIGGASHNNYIQSHQITIKSSTNNANVTTKGTGENRAAGFVGQFGDGQSDTYHSSSSSLTFTKCTNTGKITAESTNGNNAKAGAFVSHWNLNSNSSTKVTITVNSDCTGSINDLTANTTGTKYQSVYTAKDN